MTDWHYATLTETADAIRSRTLSPVELTKAMLDRIAALDPQLKAYATVTPELALRQAHQAEAEISAGRYHGALHGMPIALKDIYDTTGIVTAAGIPIRVAHTALFEAGLIVVLIPLIAWYLGISLMTALAMDIAIVAFYLVYAFFFNIAYDRAFPIGMLPTS